MARSKYIYIIRNGDEIESAFTVKHEMESYLDKETRLHDSFVTIIRIRDGGDGDYVDITGDYFK